MDRKVKDLTLEMTLAAAVQENPCGRLKKNLFWDELILITLSLCINVSQNLNFRE